MLPRHMHAKLQQFRANKSPLSQSYLHTVNTETYTPQCPLCLFHTHDTNHLFNCSQLSTEQNNTSLWKKASGAAEVVKECESRLASLREEMAASRYPWRRSSKGVQLRRFTNKIHFFINCG